MASIVAPNMTGVAQANEEDKSCSLSTLRARYVFTARGIKVVAGVRQPEAIPERIDFTEGGRLTVPPAPSAAMARSSARCPTSGSPPEVLS